jgi:NAD(P)H-dependent flavin oxidoreductase YrpB (nitropropane dioxygenase family)
VQTKLCASLDMTVPLFAFTRSKEVVVEVSKAGGMGVLGALAMSPEELERDLEWIDKHCEGKPYGVDTVMPMSYAGKDQPDVSKEKLKAMISPDHWKFVDSILKEYHVDPLPDDHKLHEDLLGWSLERGMAHVEISLKYPIRLIANALGTPPPEVIELAHKHGVKVAALCGKTKQALSHKKAGVDIIVAQGWEAGGHTGEIAGMILCPEIVDAVGDTPVVMAGGIGSGRQMAAALALGAEAVWTGSLWLTVEEYKGYHHDMITQKLLDASSEDTVRSRAISGKPARQLKTDWTEAWEKRSPGFLPMPLQWMVQGEAMERVYHHGIKALMGSPVGQIVGRMKTVKPTKQVMNELVTECEATLNRLFELQGKK